MPVHKFNLQIFLLMLNAPPYFVLFTSKYILQKLLQLSFRLFSLLFPHQPFFVMFCFIFHDVVSFFTFSYTYSIMARHISFIVFTILTLHLFPCLSLHILFYTFLHSAIVFLLVFTIPALYPVRYLYPIGVLPSLNSFRHSCSTSFQHLSPNFHPDLPPQRHIFFDTSYHFCPISASTSPHFLSYLFPCFLTYLASWYRVYQRTLD